MNIFINAVTEQGKILLFDTSGIKYSLDMSIRGKESQNLAYLIDNFCLEKAGGYQNIENIVVVHGPGSFTGIRAIVLVVNTLAFIFPHITLTPLSFFSLFEQYPIIKASSKKDLFVQFEKNQEVEIISNELFFERCVQKNISSYVGEQLSYLQEKGIKFENAVNYDTMIQNIVFEHQKQIAPLYIKKPNIS